MADPQSLLPPIIYAEASVRSLGGTSLFQARTPISRHTVDRYYTDSRHLDRATQQLRSAGFDILERGRISITIAAEPKVYERTFGTPIIRRERPVLKELGQSTTATFLDSPNTNLFGLIDVSHHPVSEVIEGIALNEPIYYFESARPPVTSYWHLKVPDGVAKELRADRIHKMGITGKGVKVAMVDSGWYRHPFFQHRGYRASVVLDASARDRDRDERGHGTGESANLFAVAPDVELVMVKTQLINAIGALKTAISLRPQIISCSWGNNQTHPYLCDCRLFKAKISAYITLLLGDND